MLNLPIPGHDRGPASVQSIRDNTQAFLAALDS